ncbi:hypothetical protein FRB94_013153 [Tulasnella sp. JGI-2019a]|nr:hypothetical protein FRB94_013153 [Tulasnella sp. JGI-2019a]
MKPDSPPAALGTFLSHLQISMEASYVSPVVPFMTGGNGTPRTGTPSERANASENSPHGRPPLPTSIFPLALGPPNRKGLRDSVLNSLHPIPSTAAHDAAFVKAGEGGAVVQSYIWGEGREKEAVDAVGKAFALLWSDEQEAWVAVYKLDIAVVWMQTRFENPLLCLTASTTLREKRLTATPQRAPLIQLVDIISPQLIREEHDLIEDAGPALDCAEPNATAGLPEVNLFSGLEQGTTFAPGSPNPLVPLPSTRLSDATRKSAYSLRSLTPQAHTLPPRPLSRLQIPPTPIPTMRKSYRKILSAVSGIRVRMRTTFVPQLILSGSSKRDNWEDHGNEERTVILSVEVENAGRESHRGFEVEAIKVIVGGPGDGAKAILIGWSIEPDSKPLYGDEAVKAIFPLRLKSVEQYNLLYAVYFSPQAPGSTLWPMSNSLGSGGARAPESQKPLSIIVSGRPWDSDEAKSRFGRRMSVSTLPPSKAFTSRWSSVLDLAATSHLVEDRLTSASSDRDAMPVPASPFPTALEAVTSIAGRRSSAPPMKSVDVAPASPVAGSKRHTIAGLQQQRMSLGRKLLIANHHASRPTSPLPHSNSTLPVSGSKTLTPLNTQPGIQQSQLQITVPPTSPALTNVKVHTGPHTPHVSERPTTPTPQGSTATSFGVPGPMVAPRRQKDLASPLPPLPFHPSQNFDHNGGINALLVSISLIPPSAYNLNDQHPIDLIAIEREKIYPLDVFALDIFVFNKSTTRTRRCMVTYPDRRGEGVGVYQRLSGTRHSHVPGDRENSLGVTPLENDIKVGPLHPESCMSVRIRFLALRPGVHTIEMLTLRDLDSDVALNLRSVMHVVVHEREGGPLNVDDTQLAEVELN